MMSEREIFLAVLDLPPDPNVRAKFLNKACGSNASLRARIEALLRSHDAAGSFLGTPVVSSASSIEGATQEIVGAGGKSEDEEDEEQERKSLSFLAAPGRADSLGRLGHYEVLEVLGQGGFGIVFRAFDEVLHRVVAVKVLSPQMAATSPARKRFLREARSSAKVRHENLVQVYAVEEQPLPYLVMEFIPGETLQQRLDGTGPLDTLEVVQIGKQIAEGLAAAHNTGLIHRDIKPANILIESGPYPRVKITDFGLARAADDASLTQSGIVAGTPMFMSPEQARGERVDHRADLFSLGSVLYTMASGRPPFRANNTLAILKRVTEETPRPIQDVIPEVPTWLCDLISRLHAKRPEDRFASAQEVADLLARRLQEMQHQQQQQQTNEPAQPSSSPSAPRGKKRRPWVAFVGLILVALLGLGFSEATGVTQMRGTVIRLFSPQGTLVVEVDDPGVSAAIDGGEVVITGTGAREIRLKPGEYKFKASKDGKTLREELVRVERNGKQVVRVHREANETVVKQPTPPETTRKVTGAEEWEKSVAALPPEEQVKAVVARLQKLNPEFTGQTEHRIEENQVVFFSTTGPGIADLAPVRAFARLRHLHVKGSNALKGLTPLRGMNLIGLVLLGSDVSDLSPLKGMKLAHLECTSTKVSDLTPLKGMPLQDLQLAYTSVVSLEPLRGMPLERLNCEQLQVQDWSVLADLPSLTSLRVHDTNFVNLELLKKMKLHTLGLGSTRVTDLKALQGMPLEELEIQHTKVADLKPLAGMPLKHFNCAHTQVSDLSPLKEMKLISLYLDGTKVTNLMPLKGMPLKIMNCRDCQLQPKSDGEVIRSLEQLETINGEPVADYLKALEKK